MNTDTAEKEVATQVHESEFEEGFGNASDIQLGDISITDEDEEEGAQNSSESEDEGEGESSSSTENSSEESNEENSEGETETSNEGEGDESGGGTSEESSENTNSEQQENEEGEYNEEEAYLALSEETGVEVSSDDDVVASLKELASLRKDNGVANLSPAIQAAIKVEQEGGNLSEHFRRVGMDFDKMDTKEVLRQEFYKDEAKLYETNPKLAKMKFERKFSDTYGKWESYESLTDEDEKAEFLEDNGLSIDDIEYEKMMFEDDAQSAREKLNAWKSEVKPVEKQNTEGKMTSEEADEYVIKYKAQVEESLSNFEAVAIQMGDGLEDYSLGLNDTTRPMVEGWVKNPSEFLQDIGFDGQKIDTNRLLPIMTLIAEASNGNLGGRIAKFAVDSENVDTIKKTLDKPTGKTGVDATQDRQGGDEWDAIGDAAEQANETANER